MNTKSKCISWTLTSTMYQNWRLVSTKLRKPKRNLYWIFNFTAMSLNNLHMKSTTLITTACIMSLIENSVEELVPQEEKQTFEAENHLWLVTSQAHQGKRAPGLCSKSYCIKGTDNGMVKVSMKGVNKNQFDNPMAHYQESLESITIFRATNLSIRRRELDMTTYCPMMDALTYFYPSKKTYHSPTGYLQGAQHIFPEILIRELCWKNNFNISYR